MDPVIKRVTVRLSLIFLFIIFIVYLGIRVKWSKLFSHGVLSAAHEELEKSGDCSACHTKGQRLDNSKCLLCHEKIKERIEKNTGFHARATKECAHCHSEHHGRSYALIHLDKETFDHAATGWALKGKHASLRCDICHSKNTYLLDNNRCVDCHTDIHLGQLSVTCDQCHSEESFTIANYQHRKSDKSPLGRHGSLPCNDCHALEYTDYPSGRGKTVRYIGIKFACNLCHEDVHDGEYGTDCSDCHNQITFSPSLE